MEAFSIFGPPGTGKTTEMLNRVEQAKERGFDPDKIGFFSFTKAATNEALKRLGLRRSDRISTLHSLMFRLNNHSTMSVVDSFKLKQLGLKIGIPFAQYSTASDTGEQMEEGDHYVSILNKARNQLNTDLLSAYNDSSREGSFIQFEYFAKSYTEWKRSNGYIDFTDMLEAYVKNPRNHGAECLFIDEAQDLSNLQWLVLRTMLKYPQVKEVHIAGDDDQAIYEWSGANTHGMAEFETEYNASRTVLGQSWRVPAEVHKLALDVIGRVGRRVDKVYLPRTEPGLVRRFNHFDTKQIKHGDDVLILCRNYVVRKEIEEAMIADRIPYSNDGGRPGLYDTKYADGIRAFNKLKRGDDIGQIELDKMIAIADNRTKSEILARDFAPMLKRGAMRSFIIPYSLVDFYKDADLELQPTIKISTIHSAKGREADHVVLHTGLTDKTVNEIDKNPDAEARVWYVGVTRAKHRLDIIEGEKAYDL